MGGLGQVISVLEAIDCVSAKGTQNKSAAQNWDRKLARQIITRVSFLSGRPNGTLSLYHSYMGKIISFLKNKKGSSYMRTSLFWDVVQHMFVNFYQRFGTANRCNFQASTVQKNVEQHVEKCRIRNGTRSY